jgi:hypothetical protein
MPSDSGAPRCGQWSSSALTWPVAGSRHSTIFQPRRRSDTGDSLTKCDGHTGYHRSFRPASRATSAMATPSRWRASTTASSIAMPAPCAMNGSIGCAASPSSAMRPAAQAGIGVALVQRGLQHRVAGIEQGPRLGVVGHVLLAQLVDAARCGPRFEVPGVLRRGREDEDVLAAVQRERDDLALRVRPPPLGERAEVGHTRHALGRHHGTVGDDAGEARALGAEHGRAHVTRPGCCAP